MAERATKKLKKRTYKAQSENLWLVRKLEKFQKDKEKCETERFANVDRFMGGELGKGDYLRVRQKLSQKAECLDQQIAEVTAKLHEGEAAADDGIRDAIAMMKKYSGEQKLTKEIADVFIDKILIYDPKHMEIQWKLPDEVIKFTEK